jgi:molybdopterin-guanine dinucleotide biosynthesis protein A
VRVPAVILAGGLSRRMGGGDKGLRLLAGRPLIAHVAGRLADCAPLALNANGDPTRFAVLGLPVIADGFPGNPGPLAGLLAAMDWAGGLGADTVVTAPSDTPFLPVDLLHRLQSAGGAAHACGPDGRAHPTVGLWPTAAADELRAALAGGMRRVQDWTAAIGSTPVAFPDGAAFDNMNTPEDLDRAERVLADARRES